MVQDTTNVQKIRFLRLNQVFDRALKQSLVKFKDWEKFSSCFPTYSKTKDGITHLMNCQKQVVEFWTGLSHKEFDELLAERHVKEKLDELDELLSEANVRLEDKLNKESNGEEGENNGIMDVPISELSPNELLDCTLYTERQNAITKLDERLAKIKNINEELLHEITQLETDIKGDLQEITDTYSQFFGQKILDAPDKELMESMHDMLVEQREYQG